MPEPHVQSLEPRRLFSGTAPGAPDGPPSPLDQPYNPYLGMLIGQLTSRTPAVLTGTRPLKLTLRLTNTTQIPQQGRIDLTYVISPNAVADKFDPIVLQAKDLTLNLKPRGRQSFSHTGIVPNNLPEGEYFIVAAVDQGGMINAGNALQQSLPVSRPVVIQGRTDVTIGSFSLRFRKPPSVGMPQTGVLSGSLRNFGNIAANGSAVIRVFATASRNPSVNDIPVTSTVVEVKNLSGSRRNSFRLVFETPSTLPPGEYFIRIEVDRTQLPNDLNAANNRNVFTSRPVRLGA